MKKSGTTTTFVLVCIAVLIASYGIGLGIRELRFRNAGAKTTASKTEKPTNQTQIQGAATERPAAGGPEATFTRRQRDRTTTEDGMGARPRFENMTEEERAQMPERTGRRGGRRGMNFENMTEEDRAAMEEQRQQMMERFENMTEEERSQFRGGRGGRGGRSRGGISGVESGANNLGQEDNNIE